MPKLNFAELDDDVREKVAARLGIKTAKNGGRPKRESMSKDEVRMWARRMLGVATTLTQSEVRRVLAQAQKMNDV